MSKYCPLPQPQIVKGQLDYVPGATGNFDYLNAFVIGSDGVCYFIDIRGCAKAFDGAGGGEPFDPSLYVACVQVPKLRELRFSLPKDSTEVTGLQPEDGGTIDKDSILFFSQGAFQPKDSPTFGYTAEADGDGCKLVLNNPTKKTCLVTLFYTEICDVEAPLKLAGGDGGGEPDPCEGLTAYTLYSKFPAPHPDAAEFPGITHVGNIAGGSDTPHPDPAITFDIDNYTVYVAYASTTPAIDSNGHSWWPGLPGDHGLGDGFIRTGEDPICDGTDAGGGDGGGDDDGPIGDQAICTSEKLGADIESNAPGEATHTAGSLFTGPGPVDAWSGTFTIIDSAGDSHTLADGATISGLAAGSTQAVTYTGIIQFTKDGETYRCNVDKEISANFVVQ